MQFSFCFIFGKNNPRNWHFENKKVDKFFTVVARIVIFVLGLTLLINELFYGK